MEAIEDPREVIETYSHSIELAKKAGFDGVEFLAQGYLFFGYGTVTDSELILSLSSGYLPHQFLIT